jgi:hypothetical protein
MTFSLPAGGCCEAKLLTTTSLPFSDSEAVIKILPQCSACQGVLDDNIGTHHSPVTFADESLD